MFLNMTEDKLAIRHKKKMERIARKAKIYQYRDEEKKELEKFKPQKDKMSASKKILIVALVLSIQIIFFTEFVMYKYQSFSSLYSLIGIPATVIGMMGMILGYFNKSKAENTKGGVIYEQAMRNTGCPVDDAPVENQSETFNSKAD